MHPVSLQASDLAARTGTNACIGVWCVGDAAGTFGQKAMDGAAFSREPPQAGHDFGRTSKWSDVQLRKPTGLPSCPDLGTFHGFRFRRCDADLGCNDQISGELRSDRATGRSRLRSVESAM